ncbi:MAG: calcium/sodium antiporter [Candidatus Omnitrophota bacterium]
MLPNILLFITGLLVLVYSSGWLIQGSVKLSYLFRLTPLFIGAVIVAFGTSAPEAGVGIMAALRDQKAVALGNIIGSNIANIGLILGLCALFRPLVIDKSVFKRENSIMIFSVVLFYILSRDLLISRVDGIILLICFIIFCFISYRGAKKSFDSGALNNFKLKKQLQKTNSRFITLRIIFLSLCGVILGADLMVRGGVSLARTFGVSPWIIGVTVFAIGTSLPELAASLTACFKKIPSLSLGNVVGSNIFNILFVLGVVSLIRPINIEPSMLNFELPALLIFTFILWTIIRLRYRITRWQGLFLLLGYIVFLTALLTN